jgi:NTE family protein
VSILASSLTVNANELSSQEKKDRPIVGVVLAGGGAKGAAHIGVLKALEELRIPVDIITGTSMGAYVGGLYATGKSAEEIEAFLHTVDWNSGYQDQVQRSERRLRDKEHEDRYQINTDLGIQAGSVTAPKGVVQGQNMMRILRETSGNLPAFKSFDDLPIRYRAVATDIVHLEQVILDSGYLVDAMMASMSVPGALAPFELDKQLLVDGGVTNNMPVDLAISMGADVIIAVDISSTYKTQDELSSYVAVGGQLSNYLVQRSTQHQITLLTDKDILLSPQVGHIGTTNFSAMPQALELGYNEAIQYQNSLERYSLPEADYQVYQKNIVEKTSALTFGEELYVDSVKLNNQSHFSDPLLKDRLALEESGQFSNQEIEEAIRQLYVLDRFERITYEYQQQDDETTLLIDVKEKEWGPNYLNFRFFLEDDFTTDSQYSLGASANFTDLSDLGAEARTNFELGTDKLVSGSIYTPFMNSQFAFNTVEASYSDEKRHISSDGLENIDDLSTVNNYLPISYKQFKVDVGFGIQPALWNEVSIGARYVNGKAEFTTLPDAGESDFTRLGVYARYLHDTLDSFAFPTKGTYLKLEYLRSDDNSNTNILDGISNSSQMVDEYRLDWVSAHSHKKHSLATRINVGLFEAEENMLPLDPYELGGFLNLSGLPRNSLIGQNKLFGSLVYRYRWFDNDFGMFKSPIYLGASAEYGGLWSDVELGVNEAPLFAAGSIFTGIDSPIGPVTFAYGVTEDNMSSVYLIIGNAFK